MDFHGIVMVFTGSGYYNVFPPTCHVAANPTSRVVQKLGQITGSWQDEGAHIILSLEHVIEHTPVESMNRHRTCTLHVLLLLTHPAAAIPVPSFRIFQTRTQAQQYNPPTTNLPGFPHSAIRSAAQ